MLKTSEVMWYGISFHLTNFCLRDILKKEITLIKWGITVLYEDVTGCQLPVCGYIMWSVDTFRKCANMVCQIEKSSWCTYFHFKITCVCHYDKKQPISVYEDMWIYCTIDIVSLLHVAPVYILHLFFNKFT